jgi:hypothetical protein
MKGKRPKRLSRTQREALQSRLSEIWGAAAEDRDLRELNLTPEEWQMVLESERTAAAQEGELLYQRERARTAIQAAAGAKAWAKRMPDANRLASDIWKRADELLATGRPPRNLASLIARELNKTPDHVRRILKKKPM